MDTVLAGFRLALMMEFSHRSDSLGIVKLRHRIILNRARCLRCGISLMSIDENQDVLCNCGYLSVSGGKIETVRKCLDLPGDKDPERNYEELSLVTRTYIRKGGLIIEGYKTEYPFKAVSPAGQIAQAKRGHWIAMEPEIGETVWTERNFFAKHTEWTPDA